MTEQSAFAYIDTHCHLDLYPSPRSVMDEAERSGVAVVAVTNAPSVFEPMDDLARGVRSIYPALGLHPELAYGREGELRLLPDLLSRTRFIGEIGLDGGVHGHVERISQLRVFDHFLLLSSEAGHKILSVHSRRATADVIGAIGSNFNGVVILHWFSGSVAQVKHAVTAGYYFSVNESMTVSRKGADLIRSIPRERVLTESDGPFATIDGHPARPSDMVRVVDRLAALWGVNHEAARRIVIENFAKCLEC